MCFQPLANNIKDILNGKLREEPRVLNVLIMCGWKGNQGEYEGMLTVESTTSDTNFTPRRQVGIGNFSPCGRSFEHASYKCYEENRIGPRNGIAYRTFERLPRKETRNKKKYESLPTLYGKFVPTHYLEWESEVEYLFDAYSIDEDDKAILASWSYSLSILEYILAYRRRKGVGFDTWSELKGALSDTFGVGQFERLEWSQAMGNSKGKQEIYISSQGIEKEESMKPSLLEKSSMNFGESSKNQEGRLGYNSIKTICFFPSNSYLYFETYFKEIKLFSLVFIEHGDHFTFLNSLVIYLERRYFIEYNSISCAIPRVDDYDFNIANCVSYVLGFEDRRSIEKELGPILEDLSISLSLNPSSLCYEVSLKEFQSLLDSYTCQDPLMSCVMFDPSCYGFGNLDDTSLVDLNIVGFAPELDRNSLQHVCTITSTRGKRKTWSSKATIKIPFKEICYLWNFYAFETLVDKLDVLFAYSLLTLECLGDFHSIVPFNASISNVAHFLWLLEGMNSRKHPLKEGVDGIEKP
ncbi:hypothetical protein M9H77_07347 [Catharanthus roseus]|uniref:Uncharacterized protein n=1 Tax=Catharanthus roseus TaxID=4058 RepID=A0ACC0BUW9_CATRO|nr:hypothetical protein M9H77_07347 [Catharanthus roseus]